jgi:outer membrane lipoprotein-sorting protein
LPRFDPLENRILKSIQQEEPAQRVLSDFYMWWTRELSKLGVAGLALCVYAAAQASPPPDPQSQLSSIVRGLHGAQLQNRADKAYQVIREYRLIDTRSSRVSSDVVAQVAYLPPGQKTYVIQAHTGSSRGEQVVKRILDHESEMSRRNSQSSSAALNDENYDFTYLGEDTIEGKECHVLGIQPKRKERELIVGRAWVDKNTFLIRRIEGDMAKTPSWLLKRVHVRLDFADFSGMWLQTRVEAVADVRFVGSQTLESRTLGCRVSSEVATRIRPRSSPPLRRTIPAELLLRPGSVRP